MTNSSELIDPLPVAEILKEPRRTICWLVGSFPRARIINQLVNTALKRMATQSLQTGRASPRPRLQQIARSPRGLVRLLTFSVTVCFLLASCLIYHYAMSSGGHIDRVCTKRLLLVTVSLSFRARGCAMSSVGRSNWQAEVAAKDKRHTLRPWINFNQFARDEQLIIKRGEGVLAGRYRR